MIPELRAMDDVAGSGAMLALAEQEFGVVTRLPDRASYDEATGCKLHSALAELGQLASWGAYDSGQPGLAQRYNMEAIEIAESLHSTYSVDLLSGLYHQMEPHAKMPAVGDFLEALRASTLASWRSNPELSPGARGHHEARSRIGPAPFLVSSRRKLRIATGQLVVRRPLVV